MKTIRPLIWCMTALFAACLSLNHADAITIELGGAAISASLSTQEVSGSTYTIHTMPVNNQTILHALYVTGTTGAAKESDLALVTYNTGVYVINTTSTGNIVVATIAETGTNVTDNSILKYAPPKTTISYFEALSDYQITLPTVTGTLTTDARITFKVNVANGNYTDTLISFFGGQGDNSNGAVFIQGTIRQTARKYPIP